MLLEIVSMGYSVSSHWFIKKNSIQYFNLKYFSCTCVNSNTALQLLLLFKILCWKMQSHLSKRFYKWSMALVSRITVMVAGLIWPLKGATFLSARHVWLSINSQANTCVTCSAQRAFSKAIFYGSAKQNRSHCSRAAEGRGVKLHPWQKHKIHTQKIHAMTLTFQQIIMT